MDKKLNNFYITTPIYYVNDKPHIGHAYTTVSADVLARYYRRKLGNDKVFFLTGTDEHGTKVYESAKKNHKTPIEFCDKNSETFKNAWKNLNISNDYFIRTTDERHHHSVSKLMKKLYDQGDVYEGTYEGLYCTGCEKFLTEKELVDGNCPYHKKPPEKVLEKNYFFKLEKYLPKVKEAIENDRIKVLPATRKKEVMGLFKQGLEDFSVSREKVEWGIPLPFDNTQKTYVWVDALQNYISAIGYGDDKSEFEKRWNKSKVIHLMAKDILKFHAIFWPALLLAAGIKPPEVIFAHGFFTVNGEKMSKSLSNVIDPNQLIDEYGSDVVRYLLLSQFPFGIDGDVKAEEFSEKYNTDLANGIGNLFERIFSLIIKFSEEVIDNNKVNLNLSSLLEEIEKGYDKHITNYNLFEALKDINSFVGILDKYINDKKPWALYKEKDPELDVVLSSLFFGAKRLNDLLEPFMPIKANEVEKYIKEINVLKLRDGLEKLNLFPRM